MTCAIAVTRLTIIMTNPSKPGNKNNFQSTSAAAAASRNHEVRFAKAGPNFDRQGESRGIVK